MSVKIPGLFSISRVLLMVGGIVLAGSSGAQAFGELSGVVKVYGLNGNGDKAEEQAGFGLTFMYAGMCLLVTPHHVAHKALSKSKKVYARDRVVSPELKVVPYYNEIPEKDDYATFRSIRVTHPFTGGWKSPVAGADEDIQTNHTDIAFYYRKSGIADCAKNLGSVGYAGPNINSRGLNIFDFGSWTSRDGMAHRSVGRILREYSETALVMKGAGFENPAYIHACPADSSESLPEPGWSGSPLVAANDAEAAVWLRSQNKSYGQYLTRSGKGSLLGMYIGVTGFTYEKACDHPLKKALRFVPISTIREVIEESFPTKLEGLSAPGILANLKHESRPDVTSYGAPKTSFCAVRDPDLSSKMFEFVGSEDKRKTYDATHKYTIAGVKFIMQRGDYRPYEAILNLYFRRKVQQNLTSFHLVAAEDLSDDDSIFLMFSSDELNYYPLPKPPKFEKVQTGSSESMKTEGELYLFSHGGGAPPTRGADIGSSYPKYIFDEFQLGCKNTEKQGNDSDYP